MRTRSSTGNRAFPGGIQHTRQLLSRRERSVCDHIESVLDSICAADAELGAFLSIAGEDALAAARVADLRIRDLGPAAWRDQPLLGIPIAVKDLIQTRDLPTTRGSLLVNQRPRVDAPVVTRLRAAGAIVIGKTTTSEHGWSASTVSRLALPTRNPWDLRYSAGGSSGGSAAAVSAGLCAAALGTDGAGSIRIPAAFCGVVGYKPSFARIPYVPACADRLSHLGPLTGNVADAIELAAVLAGPDPADPDSRLCGIDPVRKRASLRIGWIEFPGTTEEVRRVSEQAQPVLTSLGHRIEQIEVPFSDPYPALVDILAATEAIGTSREQEQHCDAGRLAVVRHGRTISGAAVMRAEGQRLALRATLGSVMDRYDLLAMATVPITAFNAEAIGPQWAADPAALRWLAWSPATYPFNMSGQPAVSLPAGLTSSGLPVGVQLVGAVGADELVLATARALEAELAPLPQPPPRVIERVL